MDNIQLQSAIKYVREYNWWVFPTREIESEPFTNKKGKVVTLPVKSPYYKGGFKNATQDLSLISRWWNNHPEAGIGVSCDQSNLICVDIDTKDGRQGYKNFMGLQVSDSGAFKAITPSGGIHIIYSGKANSFANIKTGIDIRSVGAYFIAPPSKIIIGKEVKKYVALNEWNGLPKEIPSDFFDKLNNLLGRQKRENRQGNKVETSATLDDLERALYKLPSVFYDEYFSWISVGLALKSFGEDAFSLFDKWSQQSDKYDAEELENKWDSFSPTNISVGSIFYKAYGDKNDR